MKAQAESGESLLQRALAVPKFTRKEVPAAAGELELVLAWLREEVTTVQAETAAGRYPSKKAGMNARWHFRVSRVLKYALSKGMVEIVVKEK